MKLYKSLLMAFAAMTTLFAACSEDGYWDNGAAQQANTHSFVSTSASYAYTPTDELPDSIEVSIMRGNSGAKETLKVNATFSNENLLSGDSLVVFEQGKNIASYYVKLNKKNFTMGSSASATLALDSTAVNTNVGNISSKVSVSLDYTWASAGKVSFVSEWWENSAVDVAVQKAVEGNGLYRLVDPIYTAVRGTYEDNAPSKGYYLEFELDEKHNAKSLPRMQHVGALRAGAPAYLYWGLASHTFENTGNVFTINALYAYENEGNLAGWGAEKIVFTWKEGYPGN